MITRRHAAPALWTPGDWKAFFGFGTNILVNLIVLTGLLRCVLRMPDEIVFGRILPAAGTSAAAVGFDKLAAACAVLTFFGFMHGEAIGLAVSPGIALAYALTAAGLYATSRIATRTAAPSAAHAAAE
jgi:hypothetical protein